MQLGGTNYVPVCISTVWSWCYKFSLKKKRKYEGNISTYMYILEEE